jgi:hypothetical protein
MAAAVNVLLLAPFIYNLSHVNIFLQLSSSLTRPPNKLAHDLFSEPRGFKLYFEL